MTEPVRVTIYHNPAFINVIWAAIGLYGVFGQQLGAHSGTAS
jgi:hypothetical protein